MEPATLSASTGKTSSRKLRVLGTDDRVEVTSTAYPWSAMGYLDTGYSGALIGPNAVLSAGRWWVQHCNVHACLLSSRASVNQATCQRRRLLGKVVSSPFHTSPR